MKIIVGLALFFSLCGLGNAQTQSSVKEFSDRLREKSEILSKINGNVLQMLGGAISELDKSAVGLANDVTQSFDSKIISLLMVSGIYSDMVDERDIKVVKRYLDYNCKSTIKLGELAVESINKALPTIQSTALVNEVTKLRDTNISVLQTLEFCKTN